MANKTYIFPQCDNLPSGGNVGDVLTKTATGEEWKTPSEGGGVVITVEENQTVNGYQVPKMTADDVTRAYNAVVAAVPCTVTDAQENQHFAVNQADTVSSDICVNVLYYDKMLLTYVLSGNTVETEFVPIAKAVNYSTAEQDTGLKWIDGKSIYQKTIAGNTVLSYNTAKTVTVLTDSTIEPIKLEGFVKFTTETNTVFYYPVLNSAENYYAVFRRIDNGDYNISFRFFSTSATADYYITLYYTKTT